MKNFRGTPLAGTLGGEATAEENGNCLPFVRVASKRSISQSDTKRRQGEYSSRPQSGLCPVEE